MAKAALKIQDKSPQAPAEEAEQPPKKKGKLPLILALLVVLAAAGGAWFFLFKGDAAEAGREAKVQPPRPPVFVPLEAFTVNLTPEQGGQYLQVSATLKVLDIQSGNAVKQYMPEIRHRILLLLTTKKASVISSSEGRELLSEELRQVTNNILLSAVGRVPKPVALTVTTSPAEEPTAAAEATAEAETSPGDAPRPQEEGAKAEVPAPAPAAPPAAKPVMTLAKAAADDPVQSVFFTSFIIQ